jgi:uncharacterized cupin superfamily protein
VVGHPWVLPGPTVPQPIRKNLRVQRFNLFTDDWEVEEDRVGYRGRRTSVRRRIGGERIGGSLYELDPGEKSRPYHLHHANEEWLVVVSGRPTLRTHDGERELRAGDTVCFPRGAEGAHQIVNRSDEPARVLLLSTLIQPDVAEYPDSDKVAMWGKGLRQLLHRTPQADYWGGE